MVLTRSAVNAEGNPTFFQVAFKLDDGEVYPVYSQNSLAQFLIAGIEPTELTMFKTVDANTIENVTTGGTTFTHSVSEDGQTLTWTEKGTNSQGDFSNVLVFERVG
jgi:hypothetical protein